MRKSIIAGLLFGLMLTALACNISGDAISTAISEGGQIASQVVVAMTQSAVVGGSVETPAETLPSGGVPEASTTVELGPTLTETLMPTAALPHLRVAFISGASPWLVAPPAAAYQLSSSTGVDSVDISDDGMMVAYIRHDPAGGSGELRVVNWDGSGDRSLLTSAQVGALEPLGDATMVDLFSVKWIPGTHRLLISTKLDYMGPGLARSDDLFVVNAESGVLTTVFTAGNGGEYWPSPDGTKMAISRATYISVSNIDGSGMHPSVFTFPAIITYSEFMYYPEVVWASDSSRFGVIIASEDPLTPPTSGAIWMVDGSTGAATLLSTLNGNFYLPKGVLSPTLDRVGYTVGSGTVDSYVSALDGSSALHLGTGTTAVDSFSPDGQYFAYYVTSPTTKYIGSLGGGTILVPGGAMRLKWYNNTHFIYASGTIAGGWTIKMGDTGGGSTTIATPSGTQTTFDVDE